MSKHLRVKHCIVCDDVRREDTGKYILIGVYGTDIVLNEFPATLDLRLVLFLEVDTAGSFNFQIEATYNKNMISSGHGELKTRQSGDLLFTLPLLLENIKNEGTIECRFKGDNEKWRNILRFPLIRHESKAS